MTKILTWNIQNFSDTKINSNSNFFINRRGVIPNKNKTKASHAGLRLNHILDNLQINPPDIFAVVEVRSGGFNAVIAQQKGEVGCTTLLTQLNANKKLSPKGKQWEVIPPLCTGLNNKREAVAIFYKPAVVQFKGPNYWNGSASVSKGPSKKYPVPWDTISAKTKFATQIDFKNNKGKALYFPTNAHRSPTYALFQEVGTSRKIHFFAIHTSPVQAVTGTAAIAKIKELTTQLSTGNIPANDVVVVAGDFNVSQSNTKDVGLSYGKIQALGYTQEFSGKGPESVTHLKPRKNFTNKDPEWNKAPFKIYAAAPWQTPPEDYIGTGVNTNEYYYEYPRYGYMSDAPYDTLDNIFTLYGKKAGNTKDKMIVNRVVGSPYFDTPDFPNGTVKAKPVLGGLNAKWGKQPIPPPSPSTGFVYSSVMQKKIPDLAWQFGTKQKKKGAQTFLHFGNYGGIRLTSDHMATYIEI